MLVIVLFFLSAVASAWGKRDMPMHECLEALGLGTLVTDLIAPQVDAGDTAALLKCHFQCLEQTGHVNEQVSGSTRPWHPRHRFHCSPG